MRRFCVYKFSAMRACSRRHACVYIYKTALKALSALGLNLSLPPSSPSPCLWLRVAGWSYLEGLSQLEVERHHADTAGPAREVLPRPLLHSSSSCVSTGPTSSLRLGHDNAELVSWNAALPTSLSLSLSLHQDQLMFSPTLME